MKAYIEASRKRCIEYGVTSKNLSDMRILKKDDLQTRLDKNKELLAASTFYLQELFNFVRESNFFLILTDAEGCILRATGDDEILSEAAAFKILPGAFIDEKIMGTNAVSTVLIEGISVQVEGEEHFLSVYNRWTCSAAPIREDKGNIIGVVNLIGYNENVHKHTLGMVASIGKAIEKTLEINKYNATLKTSKKHIEAIFNSISCGLLTSNIEGYIETTNAQIITMFGYSDYELKKVKMGDVVEGWSEIINKLNKGETFIDEDIYVNLRGNKLQYTLSAYPIYDSKNNIKEIVHIFYEIKKNRKLAGKILSGYAVYSFKKIIGKNERFLQTIEYAKKIADSRSTILITGESGTGKEVFAQSIHNYSIRKEEPFVAVNCGAIPATLIESELFGYEEGAFTGAKKGGNAGKFEIADEGTIFLDEIGDMPIEMQIKLLRVIEEGVINRIGSARQIPINVRIIAATNRDLKEEVKKGNFRKDLYYRLNVLPIHLPSLREHRDDIPLLVDYYMKKTAKKLNKPGINISKEYMTYLQSYDWPGNIRELENVIELIVNTGEIQTNLWNRDKEKAYNVGETINADISLEQVEKEHIIRVINKYDGNITMAAKILDIGRNTLYRKIQKYQIDCSEFDHCSGIEQ